MAMKKRLLNRCKDCGHMWFPMGFDLSRKCPNCESADVDFTGRIYLVLLALLAVAAGIFWATDRPHLSTPNTAATPTPAGSRWARHTVQPKATIPMPPLPLAQIKTEAEGRREALRLYPDLGIANTPLNAEFVARYKSYQRLQPDFFQNPAWPVILVRESAVAIGDQRSPQ
jgi:hypothetical protein